MLLKIQNYNFSHSLVNGLRIHMASINMQPDNIGVNPTGSLSPGALHQGSSGLPEKLNLGVPTHHKG